MARRFTIDYEKYFPLMQATNFGHENCEPLHTAGARVHNEWLVHYVVSGSGIFQTKTDTYHPKAGDMFIIHPDQWAYYAADKDDPWTYMWINFYSDMEMPRCLQQDILTDPRIGRLFHSLYKEAQTCRPEDRSYLLYGKLFQLFGLLNDMDAQTTTDDGTYPKPTNHQLIHQAAWFIRNNCLKSITVEDAANHIHMEYSHFLTQFRQIIGITPGKYLANIRLAHAAYYLLHTERSTKRIADELGYSDPGTFSRAFKKQYGLSPQEYAQIYRLHAQ